MPASPNEADLSLDLEQVDPDAAASDPRFILPSLDAPPAVEAGVVILGLDAERLLAGLGLAALADDPALVTLAVDRIRHDAPGALTTGQLVALGARRWRKARAGLAAVGAPGPLAGSPRRAWAQADRVVRAAQEREAPGLGLSTACAVYLTACWIRRDEIDELAAQPPATA
jgi:hypothetical protein